MNTYSKTQENIQKPEWDENLGIWKNSKAAGYSTLPDPLWIFGYGSLCYKPGDMKYVEERNGYIKHFTRRFWQKSCDHRGTPENPGLVCTLLSDEEWQNYGDNHENGIVYGKVFRIDEKDKEEVLNELDFREKGGYSQIILNVYFQESDGNEKSGQVQKVQALLYKGNVDNPNFLSDKDIRSCVKKQAEIISKSIGPSGKNIEYLIKYYQYLKSIDKVDKYMEELVQLATQMNNTDQESCSKC
ncbi:hypothetical protein ABPG72_014289 [Tetrahymena utriculariae]